MFKREPRDYQLEDFNRSKNLDVFGFLYEMGLGKSKVTIDTACHLYGVGYIDAMLIVAPAGVHVKWYKEDFLNDIPDDVPYVAAVWRSGNANAVKECERLFSPIHDGKLRIVCVNIEAFSRSNSPACDFVMRFVKQFRCIQVLDESDSIKDLSTAKTKFIHKLADRSQYKRILTGTAINNDVSDLYSQFTYLSTDILGQSFVSFKHTYTNVLPNEHPVMKAILSRGVRFAPVLSEKDGDGKVIVKNLDLLRSKIDPYCAIRYKANHLNLPDKVYQSVYYELPEKHMRRYRELESKLRIDIDNDELTVINALVLSTRLQQFVSGYLPTDSSDELVPLYENNENPRLKALLGVIEMLPSNEQVIIWCRFVQDVKVITSALGDSAVTFYGGTKDREQVIDDFKSGNKRFFVAITRVGGIGLNLFNSCLSIYYTNDYSYRLRAQSEDRQHRLGQTKTVTCIDLICENTIDEKIVRILRNKKDVSFETLKESYGI